jgi:hypothetical protein
MFRVAGIKFSKRFMMCKHHNSSIKPFQNFFQKLCGDRDSLIGNTTTNYSVIRSIHSSSPLYKGKKGNKKGKAVSNSNDDNDDDVNNDTTIAIEIPDINKLKKNMTLRYDRLNDDFKKIRSGAIRSDMFNHIQVRALSFLFLSFLVLSRLILSQS